MTVSRFDCINLISIEIYDDVIVCGGERELTHVIEESRAKFSQTCSYLFLLRYWMVTAATCHRLHAFLGWCWYRYFCGRGAASAGASAGRERLVPVLFLLGKALYQ